MPDAAHEYPRKGVIQKWRRDRAYGEVRDLQTGQCYLAPISGNRGTHMAGGQSLDGLVVRFRIRTAYQPVEWVSVSDAPPDDEKAIPEIPTPSPPVSVEPPPPPKPPPTLPARPPTPAPRPTPSAVLPSNGTIREFLQQRGVSHIYHFTRETNLAAIIQHGLLPRSVLAQRNIPFTFNDTMRLDNAQESTSVSISFPNYKMFYRLTQADLAARWVVLAIAPDILWTLRCAFCKTNAASNAVRFQQMQTRMTLQALEELFADFPHKKRGSIPHSYPTSPQAEVLVFDPIPATMIRSVCVRSQQDVSRVQPHAGRVECIAKPDVFSRRCDWADWPSQFSVQFM